ncbi:MAG: LacI family transcriptional regulator [Bacillales bacterium]|nr:LacI family transcriptional regulator [Bacillales bacterium]
MNDVARLANVSNATVSRYLNSKTFVDKEKAQAIEKAVEVLNYKQNKIARFLKTDKTMQIMMVVPDIENPYYAKMYKTIQKLAYKNDYTVLLFNTDDKKEKEKEALKLVDELRVDGLIFCSTNDYPEVIEGLKQVNACIVSSNSFDNFYFDTVHANKGESVYLGTKHLLDYGHLNIGYAGGTVGSILNKRRKGGYIRALQERNISIKEENIFDYSFSIEGGLKAGEYFSKRKDITGVACANDLIAMGIIQYYIKNNLKLPQELSIVGVDDIEYASYYNPSITTVKNDPEEFAINAMNLLLSRLDGTYSGVSREVFSSRRLIIRESTRRKE